MTLHHLIEKRLSFVAPTAFPTLLRISCELIVILPQRYLVACKELMSDFESELDSHQFTKFGHRQETVV